MAHKSMYRAITLIAAISLLLGLVSSALAIPLPEARPVSSNSLNALLNATTLATPASTAAPVLDPAGVARLTADAGGNVEISYARPTGAVRFMRLADGQTLPGVEGAGSATAKADAYFALYGSVFGITNAGAELSLTQQQTDAYGFAHLTFDQVYQGVPVFAGRLHVHFDGSGRLSTVNGYFIPAINVSATPTLTADRAGNIAVTTVGAADVTAANQTLRIFRTGMAEGVVGVSHLVYEVEVSNGRDVREFVYVDAHTGKIVDRISAIHESLSRNVYDGGYTPGQLVWQEGDPYPYVGPNAADINNLIDGTGESYNLFWNAFGRDSYDALGHVMETVNDDPGISCPNANWNGTTTNYCTGVTGDDTVAHEWGHAYTEYTHNLIYMWQPGALNESYSDIWGEVVDLINGRGTDTPGGPRSADACSLYSTPPPMLTVNSPAGIAGDYPAGSAAFGPPLTIAGLTGNVVLVDDGVGGGIPPASASTDGCEPLINGAAVAGNIALIDRGFCAFTIKVKNAQDAGAIGAIIANHITGGDAPFGMAGSDPTIVIPSLSIGYSNGNLIKAQLGTGVNVTLHLGSGAAPDDSYRWLSGEDDPAFGESIRDMWSPNCYSDPGRVTDAYYQCGSTDGGGVHTNSGVPNHTFALIVDGGTYNGQTVMGIGLTKAAHIYWRAQAFYQGPASDFADHADSILAACNDLRGIDLPDLTTGLPSGQILTAGNCHQVDFASLATELSTPPTQCNFQPLLNPNAPALCSAGQVVSDIFMEDFEAGLGSWTLTNQGVFSGWQPHDWEADNTLPGGRAGAGAFGVDPVGGNCDGGNGDVSGVIRMESPAFIIPPGALPEIAFDHYIASELSWDGGNAEASVNGGAYALIPASAFTFNAYNMTLTAASGGNTNPLAGQEAFSGTDGGAVSGSWGQSQIDLGYLNLAPGDSVRLRFDFGNDGCAGVDGWYVDDLRVFTCTNPTAVSLSELNTPTRPATWPWVLVVGVMAAAAGAFALRRRASRSQM